MTPAVSYVFIPIVIAVIAIIPLWKIFGKTGRSPWLALLVFIPGLGGLICILILAFGRWPAVDGPAPTS